jgi:hypothetical protein
MAINIRGVIVKATKQASGTVLIEFYGTADGLNSNGNLRYAVVLPSADVTSINTNVNGGSTGATRSFAYAEDANRTDYPSGYASVI